LSLFESREPLQGRCIACARMRTVLSHFTSLARRDLAATYRLIPKDSGSIDKERCTERL